MKLLTSMKTFNIKNSPIYRTTGLLLLSLIFLFFKWPDLSLPIWDDETSYLPAILWETDWSSTMEL